MISIRRSETGFHAVSVALVIVVLAAIGFVGWRIMSQQDSPKADTPANQRTDKTEPSAQEPNIQLQNIGVASADILYTAQATRDFASNGLKGFYVFGDDLPGGRKNPNFEFASLQESAKIVAAIDGVVAFVREQPESGDSEVFLQPRDGSQWTIGYDHLVDLQVKRGDRVKAGDVLGKPARQNNGLLRFEIQINKDANGTTTHICPTTLLAPAAKDQIVSELSVMQSKWEDTTKLELYDTAKQSPIGCLVSTLTPAQAEGR